MSVEVPLLKLTALSTSLKPPVATIFLFSGSFSCPSWQSKVETNSHRFVLFLQLLIYIVLIPLFWNWSGTATDLYFKGSGYPSSGGLIVLDRVFPVLVEYKMNFMASEV